LQFIQHVASPIQINVNSHAAPTEHSQQHHLRRIGKPTFRNQFALQPVVQYVSEISFVLYLSRWIPVFCILRNSGFPYLGTSTAHLGVAAFRRTSLAVSSGLKMQKPKTESIQLW
jgi:hypothetical protein